MSDDKTKKTQQDRSRIDFDEEHELEYWTKRLGVSKEELRDAVQRVGNTVEAVQLELKRAS